MVRCTHEAGGVVVPDGLGVAEGLQGGVGLDDLVLQGALQRGQSVGLHLQAVLGRVGVEWDGLLVVCNSRGPYSDLRACVSCREGLGHWAQGCCLRCSPGQG